MRSFYLQFATLNVKNLQT